MNTIRLPLLLLLSCVSAAIAAPATAPATGPATRPITAGSGAVADLLKKWWAEGTAAANVGDWYDNRDREHSGLDMKPWPQLQKTSYTEEQLRVRFDWAAQRVILPVVIFGNSSTSAGILNGGSNGRMYYTNPNGLRFLHEEYTHNNLYIYPEHQDHDPGHNGPGGWGDVYPANTPFLITSQGSSGSDQPFMQAVPSTLAAFRAEELAAMRKVLEKHKTAIAAVAAAKQNDKAAQEAFKAADAAYKAAESARNAAKKAQQDAPSEQSKAALEKADADLTTAQEARKKAETDAKAVETAHKAAGEVLTKKRDDLRAPVKEMVESALRAMMDSATFCSDNAAAIDEAAKSADERKAALAAARKRLAGWGLLKDQADAFALTPIRDGAEPAAQRLTRYDRFLVQRFNAELLGGVLLSGLESTSPKTKRTRRPRPAPHAQPRLAAAEVGAGGGRVGDDVLKASPAAILRVALHRRARWQAPDTAEYSEVHGSQINRAVARQSRSAVTRTQ